MEKTCRQHRDCLRQQSAPEAEQRTPLAPPDSPLLDRVRQHHAEINELASAGLSLNAIGRRLRLDRKTVRRYRNKRLDDLIASARDRGPGVLGPFHSYVQRCFESGLTSSMQLYRELLAMGYTGGYHVVNRYVLTIRRGTAIPARALIPGPRRITSWIMRAQEDLSRTDRAALDAVRRACPDIATADDLARGFTDMLRHRRGHLLHDWIQKAEVTGPAPIGCFADYLRRDLAAVTAGLTLPYSSGVVEGHVNRIKTIKRQMYGRASFRLLRTRVLLQP